MITAYGVQQTRDLEATAMGFGGDAASMRRNGDQLMQRAAHGLSVVVAGLVRRSRGRAFGAQVLILVGGGNNGGDALFAGARLAGRGMTVLAVRALGQPHAAGRDALLAAGGRFADLADLTDPANRPGVARLRPDVVLDGVLGIGGRPGLPEALTAVVEDLARRGVPVVAVDLPSGVAAASGAVPGAAVRADHTVTFGTRKPCHVLEPARSRCGEVLVVDIGLDTTGVEPDLLVWEEQDVAAGWPFPKPTDDKYARGVVGIDTGSETYPGAAILSTHGAVYAGAGMVRFLGPERAGTVIVERLPNVVLAAGRVQAHLVGSGWADRSDGRQTLGRLVAEGLPLVIDADGLRVLPDGLHPQVLLTPHAGELAGMLGCPRAEVEADPVAAARRAAASTGATVLLKGATQVVAAPDGGPVQVAVPGPSWTAQAGSGDVLAGICATLLAAGVPAQPAAAMAASVQAMAAGARRGPVPPQDLAVEVAALLGRLSVGT